MVNKPYEQLIDFFSENWDSTNTSGITPRFTPIINQKSIDFNDSKHWALLHRMTKVSRPAGVGAVARHEEWEGRIDVRTYGRNSAQLHTEILEEFERIMGANMNLAGNTTLEFDIINPDGDQQDRSEEHHDILRTLLPVKLIKYSVQRST